MATRSSSRALAVLILCTSLVSCATTGGVHRGGSEADRPGFTVHETLRRAIALLERSECPTLAVNFLSPIKLAQIKDLDAYRQSKQCSAATRANVEEFILAMRLALGAEPQVQGVRATIDLSGIGIRMTKLEFVKYIDGRWYFNDL